MENQDFHPPAPPSRGDFSEEMDERAAWRDFYDNFRPFIWAGLSRLERITISVAERDFHEKRRDRSGNPIRLGAKRVEGLLGRFAPGRYVVERRVVFRLTTYDVRPPG